MILGTVYTYPSLTEVVTCHKLVMPSSGICTQDRIVLAGSVSMGWLAYCLRQEAYSEQRAKHQSLIRVTRMPTLPKAKVEPETEMFYVTLMSDRINPVIPTINLLTESLWEDLRGGRSRIYMRVGKC